METPKLVRQHQKLEKFVGTWEGPEVMYPAPWCPEGAEAVGKMKCKMDLAGWFMRMEYQQKQGRKAVWKGLGMLGYNAMEKSYSLAWFDSNGGSADFGVPKGQWKGQKLTLFNKSPFGFGRLSYSFGKNGTLTFKMDMSEDEKNWMPCMSGKYTKVK